ncbi:PP2C family protein-serine/threonine phosphatase [Bogoriella caseilytica]|uniref:Serine phosphatase n=1 Tax=Bogoriella caseilytica TaxID=56055 RepID=A0A3N2BDV5_9MICO|nr:GAF domain-containing SpoIIE family protein phosphatase [Bogoriella caseilytica]ROR73415.1 serine phosphatase [Bogoriella caseilytica]
MYDQARSQKAVEALGVLDTPPDERIDQITRLAQEAFRVPMVSVTLLDRDRQWRKSEIGLGGQEAPREGAFCDATVRLGTTMVIEDAAQDPIFADNPFVTGDPHLRFYAGHPLEAPCGERIGTLCILDTQVRSMAEPQRQLLRDLATWVETELARKQELDHAVLIQRALSPRRLPDLPGYSFAADSRPVSEIGGDFYDATMIDGGLRLTVADVMGKGVGPGIVAAGVRASLRTAPGRSLAESVAEVDRQLGESFGDINLFVTGFHADLDLERGTLDFVDAGHNLGFIIRADGSAEHLTSFGMPLGMGLDTGHEVARAELRRGDTLVCCSDGVLDLIESEALLSHLDELSGRTSPAGLVKDLLQLATDRRATDDVTVLALRRNP